MAAGRFGILILATAIARYGSDVTESEGLPELVVTPSTTFRIIGFSLLKVQHRSTRRGCSVRGPLSS